MMKNLVLCALLFFCCVNSINAQYRKTPDMVQDAFRKRYPDATCISWKNKPDVFQVEFMLAGVRFTADFMDDGRWRQCEQDVVVDRIPKDIRYSIEKSGYGQWLMKDAAFIVKADDDPVYRVCVWKNVIQQKFLFFSPAGDLKEVKASR